MKYTVKRLNDGMYEYTFDGGLVFHVVKTKDGDTYRDSQQWYFINRDQEEGGDDWFPSKRAAVSALLEYVPRRIWLEPYGWVMGPEKDDPHAARLARLRRAVAECEETLK